MEVKYLQSVVYPAMGQVVQNVPPQEIRSQKKLGRSQFVVVIPSGYLGVQQCFGVVYHELAVRAK